MHFAIVVTTIFPVYDFIKTYTDNIERFDHKKDASIYIAGDRKTPDCVEETIEFFRNLGFDIKFLSINWQLDFLKKFPDLASIIPENSDNRRNVGFLYALEEGADIIISVDDDNYPIDDIDFIGEHSIVGHIDSNYEAVGENGWFNIISLLQTNVADQTSIFPRGFPYSKRNSNNANISNELISGKVGINAGLWLNDPDIDAIGRLQLDPKTTSWNKKNVFLGQNTFSPINTQNTALTREAMVSYYYVRMGWKIKGMNLDRYGDIFSGFFASACAKAVGDFVRIGTPIALHKRNSHNLFVDLYNELAGMMIIEDISSFLESVRLPSTSYYDAYISLSKQLDEFSSSAEGFIWEPETRAYFKLICSNMRAWADAVRGLS